MKKKYLIVLLTMIILTFTGCGNNTEEVLSFQNELNAVVLKIETIHNELNSIDVTSIDASEQALESLSNLKDAFRELEVIEVKDSDYSFISELSAEGADYMDQAYDLFEEAYTADPFDSETASLAYKYLERASKRINVIVTMLHGEVPDGVIVH